MKFNRRLLKDKYNQAATFLIRKMQKPIMRNNACGYLTIFHDYEGSYALPDKEETSYYGVTKLLDIEKISH